MKFFYLVWINLKRKKLRTSLTVLSIFIAFLLFGMLCAIKEAFTAGVTMAGADRLVVRHKVSLIMSLPATYGPRMEMIDGVAATAHWSWFGGIYQNDPKNFFGTFPVEIDDFFDLHPEYVLSDEQKEKWKKTRNGAIIGRNLYERFKDKFGWEIGKTIPITSSIWPRKGADQWDFEIVGVYDSGKKTADTTSLFFRYDYFDKGRERGEGEVGWYMVRVKDPDRAAEVAAQIDKLFENSPRETKAEPEGAFAQGFVQQMGNIGAMLIAILSAVFFTILLVAGNTMGQAVRERTTELGVLKSLGFTNGMVLMLVLAESCALAAVGGFAGLGVAWLITMGGSPVPTMLPVFFLPPHYLVIGAGLVLGLGVVAGILPAIAAMRLQIAVALRRNA